LGAEPGEPDFGNVVDGVPDGIPVNHVVMFTSGAKTYGTRATSLAVLLLLSHIFAVVAVRAAEQDIGVGTPPALAPGQAPPLPRPGPLAEPRSSNQVGFPTVLTQYVISPTTLTPASCRVG
jgi:hypothetical protein